MRCSDELVERVDLARGDVARERWLRKAVEQALRVSARCRIGICRPGFRRHLQPIPVAC